MAGVGRARRSHGPLHKGGERPFATDAQRQPHLPKRTRPPPDANGPTPAAAARRASMPPPRRRRIDDRDGTVTFHRGNSGAQAADGGRRVAWSLGPRTPRCAGTGPPFGRVRPEWRGSRMLRAECVAAGPAPPRDTDGGLYGIRPSCVSMRVRFKVEMHGLHEPRQHHGGEGPRELAGGVEDVLRDLPKAGDKFLAIGRDGALDGGSILPGARRGRIIGAPLTELARDKGVYRRAHVVEPGWAHSLVEAFEPDRIGQGPAVVMLEAEPEAWMPRSAKAPRIDQRFRPLK